MSKQVMYLKQECNCFIVFEKCHFAIFANGINYITINQVNNNDAP
jgi:hypothetical protein